MNLRLAVVPLALVIEGSAALLVLSDAGLSTVLAGLSLHAGASMLFGWTTGHARTRPADRVTPVLSGLVALLGFPLFGMVAVLSGSLAMSALALRPKRPLAPTALLSPSDSLARPSARLPADPHLLLAVLDVEPIADALSGADAALKQGAIDALVRSRGYRAVGTLRSLLLDPESEIRLYASVTLNKLEDEIGQAMLQARSVTLSASPEDGSWEKLAWLYVEYASCGFIAQPTVDQYLNLAHRAYEAAREAVPDQSHLALALGRAHLLFRHDEVAAQYFEIAAMRRIHDPEVHLALMELAYQRGAVAEVAQRASTAAGLLNFDYPQRALVNWWAGVA